jgi:biopolymer transport protein ExbD
MNRFRTTTKRSAPSLNTTALPDLIFTLLFFFMMVTNMRQTPVLTNFQLPEAAELQTLKDKSLLIHITVGKTGDQPSLQLNSSLCTIEQLPALLDAIKNDISDSDLDRLTVVLKIDKKTNMGTINDIKKTLRTAGLLRVFYAAVDG